MVSKVPQRLASLLREHRQLLSKIQQKKAERERLTAQLESAFSAWRHDGMPLLAELRALDQRLHALFAELLGREQQTRQSQKVVHSLYQELQASGVLSPSPDAQAEDASEEQPWEAASEEGQPEGDSSGAAEESPPRATGGTTAKRLSHEQGGPSLRVLFHRLAEVLHPDKVQDPQEKAERTELMKELTQAYHAGDLARLIALERLWMVPEDLGQGAILRAEDGELDRRCAQLEATNRALRTQVDAVKKELRALRRSPQAAFLAELKRLTMRSKEAPAQAWLELLRAQREELGTLLNFVLRYRDGQLDLRDLQRGPQVERSRRSRP